MIRQIRAISFNQPKLCPNASWNSNAVTFANVSIVGQSPYSLFNTNNDAVVTVNRHSNQTFIWLNGSTNPTIILSTILADNWSVFVTDTNDLYIDIRSPTDYRIEKWKLNGTEISSNLTVSGECGGLFVDINNTLYCSMYYGQIVVSQSLNNPTGNFITVAGDGSVGSTPTKLSKPSGIFITVTFQLYVADCGNNRIQLFQLGNLTGTTVPVNPPTGSSTLSCPTAIVLDADNYLFILDQSNNRIIGSSANGFRCVIGCMSGGGPGSNQLNSAWSFSFDSRGNVFVVDSGNYRIQKFFLSTNSCNNPTSTQNPTTTDSLTSTELATSIATTTSAQQQVSTAQPSSQNQLSSTEQGTSVHESSSTGRQSSPMSTTTSIMSQSQTSPIPFISTTVSTSLVSTMSTVVPNQGVNPSNVSFIAPMCASQHWTGTYCNVSNRPCDTINPCQNNGSCVNDNTTNSNYFCQCLQGFDGSKCQNDRRICKPNVCLNNGQCNETSNVTFQCLCAFGWTNAHCEEKINFCKNNTCQNGGVCRALFLNYTCECLGTSYSGRHCEIVDQAMNVRQTAARSLAYIAVIFIIVVVMFFIIMDVLKYFLGIDLAKEELDKMKKESAIKRKRPRKQPPMFQKFVYVNSAAIDEQ